MLGLAVELLLNWAILFWYNRTGLGVLGLLPSWRRGRLAIIFLFFAALCAVSAYIARMYYGGEVWEVNPAMSWKLVWQGIWWNLKSVWFEELIFRGALLYIMLDRLGSWKAIAVSAIAFGIYHWFSYEVLGDPLAMLYVFLGTGLAGVFYAYGFSKTRTLWVPAAAHFGWNFTNNFIFSTGKIGSGILVMKEQPVVEVSQWVYYLAFWNPMVMYLLGGIVLIRMLRKGDY